MLLAVEKLNIFPFWYTISGNLSVTLYYIQINKTNKKHYKELIVLESDSFLGFELIIVRPYWK